MKFPNFIRTNSSHIASANRNRRALRPVAVLAAGAVALFSGTVASAASVTPRVSTGHTSTTLKPDYSFYKGKTVNFIVSALPGSSPSIIAADLQPILSNILGATINDVYVGGSNVIGQDEVGHAVPDGLTVGWTDLQNFIPATVTGVGQLSFPLLSATYMGALLEQTYVTVACDDPSLTSFSQLLSTSSLQTVLAAPTTLSIIIDHLLMGMYNIPHRYLTGYTSSTLQPDCERGDGQLSTTASSQWLSASQTSMSPGAYPLLLTRAITKGPEAIPYKGVPTVAAFTKAHPPKTAVGKAALKDLIYLSSATGPSYGLTGPKGMAKNKALALQLAFAKALNTATMHNDLTNLAYPTGHDSPSQIVQYLKTGIKHAPGLTTLVNRF